jgi:cyclopropane-fatty-acyl-phospholipid synthase
MWLLDKLLKSVITRGILEVIDHDGKSYSYGTAAQDAAPLRIRLTHPRAAGHIARHPQVGAGEAFMWGWLVVESPHDIRDLVLFFSRNAAARVEAVEHTYNLTRRLYELFLDEDRQYTMAYYRDVGNSLEKAQVDKKAHLAAKLHIQPGMNILDIGCGWGGFALFLARHYDVEVTGVALAPDQIAFCKERAEAEGLADRVKFHLMDYRDVTGSFDRISSVGLLEHVGTMHYPQFYAHTHRLLTPRGVMLSHCCGRAGPPGHTDAWTRKYIFPGGYIPALSELVTESEKAGWQVMDVEAMRFHYSHTLEEWYRRTVLHREEIVALYDEQFYRMWLFYLAGAEQSFRHGNMVNWQVIYVKDRTAIPMTREWIEQESARLRAAEPVPAWHLDPGLREAAE